MTTDIVQITPISADDLALQDFGVYCDDVVQFLLGHMNLREWDVRLYLKKMPKSCPWAAEITVNYRYMRAWMNINTTDLLPLFKEGKRFRVAESLCHEMAHILTNRLWEIAAPRLSDQERAFVLDIFESDTQRWAVLIYEYILPERFKFDPPPESKDDSIA